MPNQNQNQNQRYECYKAFRINGIYACGHRPGYEVRMDFRINGIKPI
ncbi:MAG: hypothetical protein OXU36_19770 [Candidatus Poribacteria bacterium]|nr:hypothetical protein [Candidatus Poribacteria bacterium]